MAQALSSAGYDNVVVIDTQVVLEAKPLDELPWADLFEGSVLLLVCRQVQSEIDAKKSDGRIGRRARSFNKLLDVFLQTRVPASVLVNPRVDVALIANTRIDWDALDDLDKDDGDDRIVAQALSASVDDRSRIVLLSHDMRPRDAALTHGLGAVKLPENWLRDPEPSPDQRRLTELESRVRLLSADQPQIGVRIEPATPEPWTYRTVGPATSEQTASMLQTRLATAPRPSGRGLYDFGLYDSSHSDRLESWREKIGDDIPLMHVGLTRLFAQQRVRVTIENIGPISAEGLSLEIRSGNTLVHALPYWVLIAGPRAPEPRPLHETLVSFPRGGLIPRQREQFTFYWNESGPGDHIIQSCASFRQGKSHQVEVTIELLATSLPKAHIEAIVTAANMKGDARHQLIVPLDHVETPFDEVFDPFSEGLKIRRPFELARNLESDEFNCYRNNGAEYEGD